MQIFFSSGNRINSSLKTLSDTRILQFQNALIKMATQAKVWSFFDSFFKK